MSARAATMDNQFTHLQIATMFTIAIYGEVIQSYKMDLQSLYQLLQEPLGLQNLCLHTQQNRHDHVQYSLLEGQTFQRTHQLQLSPTDQTILAKRDFEQLLQTYSEITANKMSCGHSCQCQLSWPQDTLGFKRDPINSEKAWLDFAVRLLSREVVGKGKGQETVWNDKCKPDWWDGTVGVAWKNPTSNPKDTKEILQKKYLALEKHLVALARFPKELEEEAKLWNAGNVKELYLQTTLTSLLGKVTSLHCAVEDTCKKVKEMNARVNITLFNDITKCLNATLRATGNLKCTVPMAANKRRCAQDEKENSTTVPQKSRRIDTLQTTSSCQENLSSQQAPVKKPSSEILAVAQKMIDKRRKEKSHTVRNVKTIFPKPSPLPSRVSVPNVSLPSRVSVPNVSQPSRVSFPVVSPVTIPVIHISAEQINYVLTNNTTPNFTFGNQPLLSVASVLNGPSVNLISTSGLNNPDSPDTDLSILPSHSDNILLSDVLTSSTKESDSNFSIFAPSNNTSPFSLDGEASNYSSSNSPVPEVATSLHSFPLSSTPLYNPDSSPSLTDQSFMSPPSTETSYSASDIFSSGPSSCENSVFFQSSVSSDLSGISLHFNDPFPFDSCDHFSPPCSSQNSVGSFDFKESLVDHSDSDELFDTSLWEEDGSNMLEKFLQDLK
ncbi:hypothetical protein Bpfe_022700 [Biomphalaria pfeifferi]|uniref:Uncharacterized protein n=1 Tax=Biomphalaria pfeifferi TaxID=112525 RepID=A0AAD8F2D6_BIOPF|nr:hypothetical protein Bpfe_022700 [Biomphalaria pfeifferi]